MSHRSAYYDPETEKSRLLASLDQTRRLCTRAAEVLPHARQPRSFALIAAVKSAIDDYAEHEMGSREYFWGRPHSAGCRRS
jgi:hypothetical protein